MPLEIEQSRAARRDLKEIWFYAADATSPKRADSVLDALHHAYERIAEYPFIGRDRSEDLAPGLRSYVVGSYVVFYEPAPEAITVVRAERDIDALFDA